MKPKYFIFMFAIALLCACNNGDCPESKDYLIPENEKIKLQTGDTLIYISNLNNLDTIWVENRSDSKETISSKDEFFCNYEIRRESLNFIYVFINKDTTDNHNGIIQYLREDNYEIIKQRVSLNKNSFDDSLRNYIGDFTIGDSIYKTTSKFENDSNDIFQIYTNLDYGIIKYCYKNGEEFILYKYIP